ncbi:tetratricopeptide repeat protein [Cerasicoccus maritimus]|uniref:tetratricopeptide repeat protein n=1 Tax=Cerasicoccus maritimus TaxID=490089 RepID=UPI00285255FA|nr:SEL1-like repeat protein [Cerasicoccus maritimus]
MKFNITWGLNAAVLAVFLGINKAILGDLDNGIGIILVFGCIFFTVGGLLGLKARSTKFHRKSKTYWSILICLTVILLIGRFATQPFQQHQETSDSISVLQYEVLGTDLENSEAYHLRKGLRFYVGKGVQRDYENAVYHLKIASELGSLPAHYMLGICYYEGNGVEQDYSKAIDHMEIAAELGDSLAQTTLARWYFNGAGKFGNRIKKDDKKAIYYMTIAAENGDVSAQSNLGSWYRYGQAGELDIEKAAYYMEKAAENGEQQEQYTLGQSFHDGRGYLSSDRFEQDYEKAFYYMTKAAKQEGDYTKHAQTQLGLWLYTGDGVNVDYGEALKWFKLAADRGDPVAMTYIGICLYEGHGVFPNHDLAKKYLQEAADQQNAEAQRYLAYLNEDNQNYPEAIKWYRKAAMHGDAVSSIMLSEQYHTGNHVEKDLIEAYAWARIASENGNASALEAIQSKLTATQIAEGKKRLSRIKVEKTLEDSGINMN